MSFKRYLIDSELLISEIEKRPALYNPSLLDYCDKATKNTQWAEICDVLLDDWRTLEPTEKTERERIIQKRWKSLRDCFTRELTFQKSQKGKKGQNKRRKYIYFEQLQFLQPYLEMRSFPNDKLLSRKWVQAMRRKDFKPTKYSKLCSKHFTENCYKRDAFFYAKLTEDAVPTLFDFTSHVRPSQQKSRKPPTLRVKPRSIADSRLQKFCDGIQIKMSNRKERFICSDHFEMTSFTNTFKRRLLTGAVPTLQRSNEFKKQSRDPLHTEKSPPAASKSANLPPDIQEEREGSSEPLDGLPTETTPMLNQGQSSNYEGQRVSTKSKKREATSFENELLELIKKRKYQPPEEEEELDDDKAFLMSLLPTLKQFNDDQKFEVRIAIMNAIQQVQRQQPPTSSRNSPPRPILHTLSAAPPLEFSAFNIKTSPKSPLSQEEEDYATEYDKSSTGDTIGPSTSRDVVTNSYSSTSMNSPSLSDIAGQSSIKDEDISL